MKKPIKKVRPLSEGEEMLAIHLRADGIAFERESRLCSERRWRWDFVIHEVAIICIDIQGGTFTNGGHVRGKGYQNDLDKHNSAILAGHLPLLFTTADVKSGVAITTILKLIRRIDRQL